MARICSIHQPSYWPYLGFFEKVARSHVFVFLDDVQYVKNDFKNRNRIFINSPKSPQASRVNWLTLPVKHESLHQTIAETIVVQPIATLRKHFTIIGQAYGAAPGFRALEPELNSIFQALGSQSPGLSEINMAATQFAFKKLRITTEIFGCASSISAKSDEPTQRLIDICKHVGADTYLAGAGGREYMQMEEFQRQGIDLVWQDWRPFAYNQRHSEQEFVPYLSCLDFILNLGSGAGDFFWDNQKETLPCSRTHASP